MCPPVPVFVAPECRALIEYRAFRNTDPPQLAEIWRSQTAQRGLMQPMSIVALERYIFSKPSFDRNGLIVAVDEGKLLAFAHAGFGSTPDQARCARSRPPRVS